MIHWKLRSKWMHYLLPIDFIVNFNLWVTGLNITTKSAVFCRLLMSCIQDGRKSKSASRSINTSQPTRSFNAYSFMVNKVLKLFFQAFYGVNKSTTPPLYPKSRYMVSNDAISFSDTRGGIRNSMCLSDEQCRLARQFMDDYAELHSLPHPVRAPSSSN